MSRKEVDNLAKQVGLPIPTPLRDFLLQVGPFQDLTWGVSDIELYDAPEDFVLGRRFLCDILRVKQPDLFPFGGDGAGNEFCLPTAAGAPCMCMTPSSPQG